MKIKTVIVASLLSGLLLGAASAYLRMGDPGSDFSMMAPRAFPSVDAVAMVGPVDPNADSRSELPIVVVDGEEFDFGVMDEGEVRSHEFVFRNNTKENVTLEVKETTCKCTVGELENDTILPGEEVNVKLEWKPIMLQRDFRQTATIATTCEERASIVLAVFGRVSQSLMASPRDIVFSDVSFRTGRESPLVIHAIKNPDFEIIGHTWEDSDTAEYFDFEAVEVTDEHRAAEKDAVAIQAGVVKMKPGLPLGPFRQILRLQTNVERFGQLEIPVRGQVVGDISMSGSKYVSSLNLLRLGPVPQRTGAETKVRLTVKGPHAKRFEITEVRTVPDLLNVEVIKNTTLPNGMVTLLVLRVEVPPGASPVNFSGGKQHEAGKIVLQTTHPELKEVPFGIEFAVTE